MTISVVTLAQYFLIAIAIAMGVVAVVAFRGRRRAPDSGFVTLIMVAAAFYCFGYAHELAQTTLEGAMFWLRVEYIGIPWIPALWVLLTRRHFGLRSPVAFLVVLPVVIIVAEWTNSLHGLYDISMVLVPRGPFWVVVVRRGPIAWLNLCFVYGSLLYGAVLCAVRIRATSGLVQLQMTLFATSCLPPLIGYSIYLFGWSPWGLDLAPVMLCLSLIIGYVTVFRLECFNLVPMARSLVFKSIRDAVLVTDLQHRLVDFNPAACALLPRLSESSLGSDIATVFPDELGFEEAFRNPDRVQQLELCHGDKVQQFEMSFYPLGGQLQQLGWATILANITAQLEVMSRLQRHAETDSLTGIANRRAFTAAIEHEYARSARYPSLLGLMLIDVDHFKAINDENGHGAGDRALRAVAHRVGKCLRTTDLFSRYGGDEFAILLPETGIEDAQRIADRIRASVEGNGAQPGIPVTVSIGIAVRSANNLVDPAKMMDQADQALYQAKSEGRNRIAIWKGLNADTSGVETGGEHLLAKKH